MKLEIDLKNVHIDEIKELKDYLENNCWEWKEIKKQPKRPKKDNSKKGDIFVNCRHCGEYIRGDFRSNFDGRYCQDCL